MSDCTVRPKLKPCPFCGGENIQVIEYKAGYGTIGCGDCCFEYPDNGNLKPLDELRDAWNTRATLGGGKLTAEQVRHAANGHYKLRMVLDVDGFDTPQIMFDWQAIADELNAALGGGECEFELNTDMSAIRCSACGYELPKGTNLLETRFCGGCGKAVRR